MRFFVQNLAALLICCASHAQLAFQKETDLGIIPEASEVSGDVVLKNEGSSKIFLMRADAAAGVKVFASKKTILPGDTCLLVISFLPETSGSFRKNIELVSSDRGKPYELSVSGNIQHLKKNDKMACFYFGSRKPVSVKVKEQPASIPENTEPRDVSNKIPDHASEPAPSPPVSSSSSDTKTAKPADESPVLPEKAFKPNNIVFLVDVSNSMKDSMKLPLMKEALYTLIDAVRGMDVITLGSYADSTKVLLDGVSGAEKQRLRAAVSSLKAGGMTKGKQAILKSQGIAQKHYIAEGNNQIILATDGKFMFYSEDYQKWRSAQGMKPVVLSTVAFGNDKDAMKNLKEIARKGEGSFIHVKKRHGSEQKLIEEVKERSKK